VTDQKPLARSQIFMSTQLLTDLNLQYAIPSALRFEAGQGNLLRAVITASDAEAHVYLHGAHVTHYQPIGQLPVLFMSRKSHFASDKPIRGGIPVIFPWFGPRAGDPSAPAHGFARTTEWSVIGTKLTGSAVSITLALFPSEATRRWFPQDFELRYEIQVGATLSLSLEVRNRSASNFAFEQALHTYLSVGDVRQANIEGLDGRTFIDKTAGGTRTIQPGPLRIERETDRVYLDTTDDVRIADAHLHRNLLVTKTGSNTTVVWNPWIEKAKSMADFGDDEWPSMLCIETANASDNAVTLAPGQSHTMTATIVGRKVVEH
jgi:glucose-6-phosphate 1-epimerase